MKQPFSWDSFSDQPYQLKERAYKKAMRKKHVKSLAYTALVALTHLPLALLFMPFTRKRRIDPARFFAMSVNLDKEPDLTPELIKELGAENLLVRFPLWEIDKINAYTDFLRTFRDKELLINVMQDREHIEDPKMLETHLHSVFEHFSPYAKTFQIATTINRAKWGFFSVNEYLGFFEVARRVQEKHYPDIRLIGPSVIDFEYHFTAHALFNLSSTRFDALSALLYVDRRGAPENGQMGFNLMRKIRLLSAMAMLSPKVGKELYITETNWPITGTVPYAPTSEFECVDEESYADFMVRYYLIAFASKQVDAVYWHQLVAPGYGLIDNRDGLRKRTAFTAFKTMLAQLRHAEVVSYSEDHGSHLMRCRDLQSGNTFHVCWSLTPYERRLDAPCRIISRDGEESISDTLTVTASPCYLHTVTDSKEAL